MGQAVVRRVDHVNVRVSDPEPLFSLFAERFELPVVWPVTSFPSFANGSVALGNMTLEPTSYGGSSDRGTAAELFSICFEPEPVAAAAAELKRRGISHSPPVPYVGTWPRSASTELFHPEDQTAGKQPLWTWIFLGGFLGDATMARRWSNPIYGNRLAAWAIGRGAGNPSLGPRLAAGMAPRRAYPFFCQWEAFDIEASREQAAGELRHRGGGPLGLVGVREIIAATVDLERETPLWRKLLEPAPETEPGRWELGGGPGVRLVAGEADGVEALVCNVSSLERAASFLRASDMLGVSSTAEARIAPEALGGLDIRLVEA